MTESAAGLRATVCAEDVSIWPLEGDEIEIASSWLAEERNARWLDFGTSTPGLGPLALKMMAQRDQHSIWVYGPSEDRTPVGLVAFGNISRRFKSAEAWCVLGAKAYGPHDVTIRAVDKLLEHGFRELGLHCIYAWTVEINRGGRRILERVGFRPAGRLRSSHRIGDRIYDRLWFDLLAHEYQGFDEQWRSSS